MPEFRTPMKLIQATFKSAHYRSLFVEDQKHDAARNLIAQLVAYTQDADYLGDIVGSALGPDYAGDTLQEVPGMVQGALAKGFDQRPGTAAAGAEEEGEPSPSQKLLHAVEEAGVSFFHDDQKRAFMSVPQVDGGLRHWLILSKDARSWCRRLYFTRYRKPLSSHAMWEALETLAARAQFDAPERMVALRVGGSDDRIAIDLGRPERHRQDAAPRS